MSKDGKKLRWYKVSDDETTEMVAAYSHSRAKIKAFSDLVGAYTPFECLTMCRAKVVKQELDQVPKFEGDLYSDWTEIVKKGVFPSVWTHEPCENCKDGICGECGVARNHRIRLGLTRQDE